MILIGKIEKQMNYFVDFETFNDICQSFDTLPKQESFNIIYLIGVGWIENNKWHYKKFICDKPTKICELTIMKNFIVWVEQMGNPPFVLLAC